MKQSVKISSVMLCVVALLLLSQQAFANENAARQNPARAESQQVRQEAVEKRRLEAQDKVQERADTTQDRTQKSQEAREAKTAERRGDLAQVHAERLQRRFGFYYERLSGLIQKLESRLATMAQDGADVAAAQSKLGEAIASLEEAKILTDQAIAAFLEIDLETETAREQAQAAKELAQEARELYREAVSLIKEALRLAKATNQSAAE